MIAVFFLDQVKPVFNIHDQLRGLSEYDVSWRKNAKPASTKIMIRDQYTAIASNQCFTGGDAYFSVQKISLAFINRKTVVPQHLLYRRLPYVDFLYLQGFHQRNKIYDDSDFTVAINKIARHREKLPREGNIERLFLIFVQRRILKIRMGIFSFLKQRLPNFLQHLFLCRCISNIHQ